MPGRLAVDFGTSNTVLCVWDEATQTATPVHVPDLGRDDSFEGRHASVVPSLIHYAPGGQRWLGNQALARNLYHAPATFRWMKRYIAHRNPGGKRVGDKRISHRQAGTDFLSSLLVFAAEEFDIGDEEIALTVPVEAFEDYENWLAGVAEEAGLPRFRIIDEPSAAALGYGAHIQPNDVYLIFDFGGGTLDVSVVLVESQEATEGGRRCRVLGKAGADVGGCRIDQWLFQEALTRTGRTDADDDVRPVSNALLVACERAKERLSEFETAGVSVVNPTTGAALAAEFTRDDFEDILDRHDAFATIDRTVRRALNAAAERGYTAEHLKAVLMVGGSSRIPAVRKTIQRIFGRERVMLDRPMDAVARGAAAFVAGVDFYDHIHHDYAVRYIDRQKGDYDYMPVVKRGTPYPTEDPVARLTIKGAYEGQTQLGLIVFEVGRRRPRSAPAQVEIQYDPTGAARLVTVTPDEEDQRRYFQIGNPTFLTTDPPAKAGEPCFRVEFGIDGNKRLLIGVWDMKKKAWTHRDYPMVKLT